MSTAFSWSGAGMEQVQADMAKETERIMAVLQQLQATAKRTILTWEGAAQNAYQASEREWNSAANQMADSLRLTGQRLTPIGDTYIGADNHSGGEFSNCHV